MEATWIDQHPHIATAVIWSATLVLVLALWAVFA